MSAFEKEIRSPNSEKIKLLKWKVRKGSMIYKGSVLALYSTLSGDGDPPTCKLKAEEDGTVAELVAEEGKIANEKDVLLKVQTQTDQECTHPTIMKDMCANCGADLRMENGVAGDRKKSTSASVAMVHSIPELIVSEKLAMELGKEDENRLLRLKKLVLLVDLDQTLIHTTNDQIPSNLKDVKHFQLWDGHGFMWYHTRFRPFTLRFLEAVSKMYELHICTFGVRMYAHTIARLLDPEEKYFSHRILSRDECFDSLSKTANLKALFPCGDKMVGIIDDREDVWNFAPNLIHVKAYRFFQGTADINAPPGLTKSENDNVPIVHKTVGPGNSPANNTDGDNADKDCPGLDESDAKKDENSPADVQTPDEKISCSSPLLPASDGDKDGDKETESSEAGKDGCLEEGEKKSDADISSDKAMMVKGNVDGADSDRVWKSASGDTDSGENGGEENKENNTSDGVETSELMKAGGKEDGKGKDDVVEMETETDTNSPGPRDDKKEKSATEDVSKSEEVEWDDPDDYLLHLEEILTRIHEAYYNMYGQSAQSGAEQLPDLKNIIPYVKKKVLKGANIVFSGMFPVNMAAERSRAHIVAKSLGATVQADIVPNTSKSKSSVSPDATTHLVAAKAGTGKYKTALKAKGVHIVNGDWLWACSERWEWVSEQLFLLPWKKTSGEDVSSEGVEDRRARKSGKRKRSKGRNDDNNDEGDEKNDVEEDSSDMPSTSKKKRRKGKKEETEFASSYNPLLSFSNEDIEFMDKEVDEIMAEDEDDSDESDEERDERIRKNVLGSSSDSDSDSDSLAGDFPRGWKMRRKSLSPQHKNSYEEMTKTEQDDEETESELERYQKTMEAFAPNESDSESACDSIGSVDEEIAAAVEKEFLGSL